jgi:glycosyltransferase involved in cell wall biosynthesis
LYELKSSYKVIEAMSHGKPVIVTNLKAMSEIIIDNENGLLCNPDDINDLLEKIKMVMNDTDLRLMMGNNALDYIKNNDIDINSVCVKLSSIYDGLLNDVCNDYGDVVSDAIVQSENE